MEYSDLKVLAERWLAGETTLTEENALREHFGATRELSAGGEPEGVPADMRPLAAIFAYGAEAADERPARPMKMHTVNATPKMLRRPMSGPVRLWIAATVAAAAVIAGIALFVALPHPAGTGGDPIVCMVNGVRITDPDQIAAYTLEALQIASDNLRRPSETISATLGNDPAIVRVGEMLDQLTKNEIE
jgi:hypothetical protein